MCKYIKEFIAKSVLNIPHPNWHYCLVLGLGPDRSPAKFHHPAANRRLASARNVLVIYVCVENKDEFDIYKEVAKIGLPAVFVQITARFKCKPAWYARVWAFVCMSADMFL